MKAKFLPLAVIMIAVVFAIWRFASPPRAASSLDFPPPDQPKAVEIKCASNMKQIALALRIWEGDHNDSYPWNVSTNQGGTLEFCARNKNGFDTNAALHFLAVSNELLTPLLLVCPQDTSKKAAVNFGSLGPSNVTYLLRTGTNINDSNPKEIIVICPIDGNTLYIDGSVVEGRHKQ